MIIQTEILNLKSQMTAVYDTLSNYQALINSLASTKTLSNLNFVINQEIGTINSVLAALDARISLLEEKVTTLENTTADHETRLTGAGL